MWGPKLKNRARVLAHVHAVCGVRSFRARAGALFTEQPAQNNIHRLIRATSDIFYSLKTTRTPATSVANDSQDDYL